MTPALQGFHIRPPTGEDAERVTVRLSDVFRFGDPPLLWAALGQPGDELLGGIAVRPPDAPRRRAMFELFVEPTYRRRGVGSALLRHVYRVALENNASGLQLNGFVNETAEANHFLRAMGMAVDRRMGTYYLPIAPNAHIAERIMRRFGPAHPHLAGAKIVPLTKVEPQAVARFLTSNYPCGTVDWQLHWLASGHYDLAISTGLVRDGELLGTVTMRSQESPTVFLDLVLVHPTLRSGPAAVLLIGAMVRLVAARGYTHMVYEGDADHDRFAVHYARRCGGEPKWHRFRYVIDRDAMAQRVTRTARAFPEGR